MLKILYISPENTAGTLNYWKKAHELNNNFCRFVTFFKSAAGYEDDILLNLPLIASRPWYLRTRLLMTKHLERRKPWQDLAGHPPIWQPPGWQKILIRIREWLWTPQIKRAIQRYNLDDFDIYHFEWGTDFYRNAKFARKLKERGKKIICHYHGQDMRHRGVIPAMDQLSDLNLTNELDLLARHPDINYIFLPFDVQAFKPQQQLNHPLTICHATTNRKIKGSDHIINVCKALEKSHGVRFIFIENKSHKETLRLKQQADIYIDQITDWAPGYGMNSLEALSLGVVCVTYLNPEVEDFLGEHPFVNASTINLKAQLLQLIEQPDRLLQKRLHSRQWVADHHDYRNVVKRLYQYYRKIGIMD